MDLLSPRYTEFLKAECLNEHLKAVVSDVSPRYRPAEGNSFPIKHLQIPIDDLQTKSVDDLLPSHAQHTFGNRNGARFIRFFVHPESEDMYADLFARYPCDADSYVAFPTASTRTVLLQNMKNPNLAPIFVKLSLNRKQFGLVRLVPDWEIRRSVAISKLTHHSVQTAQEFREHGLELIAEVAGAYIGPHFGIGEFVDHNQYHVFRHGLLFRDASFLETHDEFDLYPLFALFAATEQQPPLLVRWWQQSGEPDFDLFVADRIIEPFVKATAYLVFFQGIVPDAHGQNIVVAVDHESRHVRKVLHRDLGSMKVSLRMRLARGLPIEPLLTGNAMNDFKFEWSEYVMGTSILDWFYNYVFRDSVGHESVLRRYVRDYSGEAMRFRIATVLKSEMRKYITLGSRKAWSAAAGFDENEIREHVDHFISACSPQPTKPSESWIEPSATTAFIHFQEAHGQSLELPASWAASAFHVKAPEDKAVTQAGVVYFRENRLKLALRTLSAEGAQHTEPPTHYQMDAPIERIFASQSIRLHADKSPQAQVPFILNGAQDVFPCLRAGSPENSFFHLLDGLDRSLAILSGNAVTSLRVEIVDDIRGLPKETQERILRKSANFWSPTNPEGAYVKLALRDVPPSPWADYYWTLDRVQRNMVVTNDYLPEIDFAKRVYTALARRQSPQTMNTIQSANEIATLINQID